MKKKTLSMLILLSAVFLLNSCNKVDFSDIFHHHGNDKKTPATVAMDWYKLQIRILLERNSALNGVNFAYIGIGLYEAARFDTKNSISLSTKLYQMPAMPDKENNREYNWQESANAALASLVKSYYTGLTPANLTSIDSLENAWNEKLSAQTSTSTFDRSQAFGRSIATAVYNWSLTDGANYGNAGYIPPVFPGAWVPTPPAFANGINPYLGTTARPLLPNTQTAISAPFSVAYSENTHSEYYKMVKKLYDLSKVLTDEQKQIALYWVDLGNGIGVSTAGHEFSIILQAMAQEGSDLGEAAEVLAKAGIAERESALTVFRSKYTYNLVRPVTYIQKLIQPDWLPFIVTPPHPEFPAAHAMVTGTVMNAVSKVLGDHVKITDHTYDFRGWAPRTFNTLVKAGEEAGMSRYYGGIHYLISIDTGLKMAEDLGGRIGKIKLHD